MHMFQKSFFSSPNPILMSLLRLLREDGLRLIFNKLRLTDGSISEGNRNSWSVRMYIIYRVCLQLIVGSLVLEMIVGLWIL